MSCLYLITILSASIQVTISSTSVKKIQVPENYKGTFPFYLTKTELGADGRYIAELAGDDDGIFELDPDSGVLCALKPFDRENKDSYAVTVTAEHRTMTIYIEVTDENDNMPILNSSSLNGIVSRGSRAGVAFMHLQATDADDPTSENADLRYSIQGSDQNVFQMEPRSGAVSLTEEGATYLSRTNDGHFRITVQVKDLGDDPKGNAASGSLEIVIAENTWFTPSPFVIPENLKGNYPHPISKVLWNSTEVQYSLSGNFEGDLFTVDESGNIYVTNELDWERQSQYKIQVSSVNADDVLYSDPLEISVKVMDENDNGPVFPQDIYHVEITEKSAKGLLLIELKAEDADDPGSSNAQIRYRIVSQEPPLPSDNMFHIGESTGQVTLLDDSLKPETARRYTLEVLAADLGGAEGGLSGSCTVIIEVMDINNYPPVFVMNQFPPFVVPEDMDVGAVIATLTATDQDVDLENKLTDFSILSENEDQTFGLTADHDGVSITLQKDLDYEQVNKYILIIEARNRVELSGAEYGDSSTATILISVHNVNEAPVFTVDQYEAQVAENAQIGSIILTVEAFDPDVSDKTNLRYSITNDSRTWFSITEDSGQIQLLHSLDRTRFGDTYHMQVIARDRDVGGLSATADVTIRLMEVDDVVSCNHSPAGIINAHVCTPKRETQRVVLRACDRGYSAPFTFRLPDDTALRRQWKVTALNGTHAYLSMVVHYIEPTVQHMRILITDNGTDPQSQQVQLRVKVCHCNTRGHCKINVDRMEGMPTVSSALGIILGTLAAIGLILIIVFCRLAHSQPIKSRDTPDAIPLRSVA
ncbi:cadherin-16 isoform 2-T4 [Anomaloglossus baeobatrachus]|uniref:cadherin-16 isoform X2 n=1 Tax=Anomaloglossus baeobatrachus TaxID=238106 RepID=UPI003F500BBC